MNKQSRKREFNKRLTGNRVTSNGFVIKKQKINNNKELKNKHMGFPISFLLRQAVQSGHNTPQKT